LLIIIFGVLEPILKINKRLKHSIFGISQRLALNMTKPEM